jgi:hypothetical protein
MGSAPACATLECKFGLAGAFSRLEAAFRFPMTHDVFTGVSEFRYTLPCQSTQC